MVNPGGGRRARRRIHMAESINTTTVDIFDVETLIDTWEYTYPPSASEFGSFLGWACRKGFLECVAEPSDGPKQYIRLSEVVLE